MCFCNEKSFVWKCEEQRKSNNFFFEQLYIIKVYRIWIFTRGFVERKYELIFWSKFFIIIYDFQSININENNLKYEQSLREYFNYTELFRGINIIMKRLILYNICKIIKTLRMIIEETKIKIKFSW